MFVLSCEIKIGGVSFKSVNEVRISRSLYSLSATATVKVPVTAVLKHTGEPPTHIELHRPSRPVTRLKSGSDMTED